MIWAELEEEHCPCQGTGWAQMPDESWETCFLHFQGQLHPESKMLLLDDKARLQEEERRSHLRWKIGKTRDEIADLATKLREQQALLVKYELELINKTPTVRMPAINPEVPILELSEEDLLEDDFPL
jgi:hypothetical protein